MPTFVFKAQRKLKKIDRSKTFQGLIIVVILLSALLIGAKTYNLPDNAMLILSGFDLAITLFFVIEII